MRRPADPGHPRQIDIHQDHIGLLKSNFFQRIFPAIVRADAPGIFRPIDQDAEAVPYAAIIFDN